MIHSQEKMEVTLYMYDLSGGMAAAMSQQLIGSRMEAIWHTAIVVNGREFFFDSVNGIDEASAGSTRFGMPMRKEVMGTTTKSLAELRTWNAQMMKTKFGPWHYQLLTNNCNHYSADTAAFLGVGTAFPVTVTGMVGGLMASPIGVGFVAGFLFGKRNLG